MNASKRHMAPVSCLPWCAYGDGHPDQISTDDQSCMTTEHRVETLCYPPTEQHDHTWSPEYITAYGMAWAATDRAPRVWIGVGESSKGLELTVAEARKIAATILKIADDMEAGR